MELTRAQTLGWRASRQFLTGEAATVEDVVGRLVAVPAWSGDPEFAVRLRLGASEPGLLDRAVEDGRLVKVFAFRGATHLMTPEQAAVQLALRAAGRMWEKPSWQQHYQLAPSDWPRLRAAVRDALADGPLTCEQLAAAVASRGPFRHLRAALSTLDTFVKPFFWQGDVCFGPSRDGVPTLRAMADIPHWPGLADLEVAGPQAVLGYLAAYGPATADRVQYWLGEGLGAGRRRIRGWLADLDDADRITGIDVDGAPALLASEHLDELPAAPDPPEVVLLTGHDQWILGPGTADAAVVPPGHRPAATRGANLVLAGGVVAGTWKVADKTLTVSCSDPVVDDAAAERVAELLGRPLQLRVDPA